MGTVQLNDLEAGGERKAGGFGELVDDFVDLRLAHGVRFDGVVMERHRARRPRHPTAILGAKRLAAFPRALATGLAAGMGDLDAGDATAILDQRHQPLGEVALRLGPQAQAARRDPAQSGDVGRFSEHDAGATHGFGAEVLDVPVGAEPVLGSVLAHRRDRDAVLGGDAAQGERLE